MIYVYIYIYIQMKQNLTLIDSLPVSVYLLLTCLLLQLSPLSHRLSQALPYLGVHDLEPANNALPIAIAQFLTHLEFALQALDANFYTDDIFLQKPNIRLWRVRHVPRLSGRIAHQGQFGMPRQIVQLLVQKGIGLLRLRVAVYLDLSVSLCRGVVPRRTTLPI